jgi:hypothetical protein
MKTMSKVIMLMAVIISFSAVSFAQDPAQTKAPIMGGGMMSGGMMGSGKGVCMGSMGTMMGMMNNLVATSDGGVVVMIGNKLYKYDKNLNLVKEAEIKVDFRGMQRMMEQFPKTDNTKGKAPNPSTPKDLSGHESHHPQ